MSFHRAIILALVGFLLAIIQASFLAALPAPFSLVQLPLAAAATLVQDLRIGSAFLMAAASGLTADALVPGSGGLATLAAFALVAAATMLFTRVFTNTSLPAHVGLHGILFAAAFTLGIVASAAGVPIPAPAGAPVLLLLAGAALHIALAAGVGAVSARGKKAVARLFFT